MMGLPVVATDVGSVRELVSDDATGIVVRPTDAEALAEAIVWMLSDPALLASFGARGREVAIRRFSATECARIHVEAYRHALSRRRPG